MMTQSEMILEYLKKHGSITPLEALEECGSMRLSARIKELRDGGHNIVTVNVQNGRTIYARYVLKEENK